MRKRDFCVFLLCVATVANAVFALAPVNPGDLNADNIVNFADVSIVTNCLGQNAATCSNGQADPNNDNNVNIYDFIHVAQNWGKTYGQGVPPTPGAPQFSILTARSTNSDIRATWPATATATSYRYVSGPETASPWSGQQGAVSTTQATLQAVPNGAVIYFCVWAANSAGESASSACNTYTVPTTSPQDTTPPAASITAPTSNQVLLTGTTQTTLSVTTNEASTCKWSTTNVAYSSMTNTFTTTGSTSHSTSLTGLANGQSYTRYVRCSDTAGNAMTTSSSVTFSVTNPTSGSTSWLTIDFSDIGTIPQLQAAPWFYGTDYTYNDGLPSHGFNTRQISIDTTDGYGGSPNSLRYDWAVGDGGVGIGVNPPSFGNEYWTEIWAKLSPSFVSTGQCNGNNPDYKFVFWMLMPGEGRNEIKIGNFGNMNELDTRYNFGPDTLSIITTSAINSGQWHRYRIHNKVGTNAIFNVEFWDGANQPKLLKQEGFSLSQFSTIQTILLGANRNCAAATPMWLKWGKITLYNQDPGWGY